MALPQDLEITIDGDEKFIEIDKFETHGDCKIDEYEIMEKDAGGTYVTSTKFEIVQDTINQDKIKIKITDNNLDLGAHEFSVKATLENG